MSTESQKDLAHAASRVNAIHGEREEAWCKRYGQLCHSFPILVRSAGLAQAIEFHREKAGDRKSSPRERAHARLVADFEALLPPDDFSLGRATLTEYMRATRRVLRAWVFYKRFAKSILGSRRGGSRR